MRSYAVLVLAFCTSSHGLVQEDAKNRPVSKVITLLKDMVTQLEREAEEDKETYEEMQCWCETNDREKTAAIAAAESKINALTSAIESFTANSARLNTEISNLDAEVSKNTEALEKATAMRRKELAEFNAEEKENIQTIASLKSAVVALSKHHEAAFIQESTSTREIGFLKTMAGLKIAFRKHADILAEMFTAKQRRKLASFMEVQPSLIQTDAPASGEIFGMLKGMKESFEMNLANSQKEETQSQTDFENLKKTKTDEIDAGTSLSETKTQELATTDEKNAESKQDLEDTRATLEADTEFLAEVKAKCEGMDAEYAERTKTRQLEIQAVSKALAFLNSDEAHELFSKTLGFIQTRSAAHSKRRGKVSKALKKVAEKFQDPRVSLLATKARLDAFTEVKKDIQEMIDALVKEKQDEIKLKDYCVDAFNTNEADTEAKERSKADLTAKIEDLSTSVATLGKEIKTLKAEVAEMQVQLKRAGEDREKMNKEFNIVVADQRATQKLLAAALNVLKGFYEKAALLQKSQLNVRSTQPEFKSYEKNKQSGGVMGMMEEIINEAKGLEAEAVRGEEDAQKAYEDFVKESNNSMDAKTKDIVNKSENKAKAEAGKVEAEKELGQTEGELESLASANADLHKECDFTLKNFELRQGARDGEIEALKQCLAIFSGASFSAFLQVSPEQSSENELDQAWADFR